MESNHLCVGTSEEAPRLPLVKNEEEGSRDIGKGVVSKGAARSPIETELANKRKGCQHYLAMTGNNVTESILCAGDGESKMFLMSQYDFKRPRGMSDADAAVEYKRLRIQFEKNMDQGESRTAHYARQMKMFVDIFELEASVTDERSRIEENLIRGNIESHPGPDGDPQNQNIGGARNRPARGENQKKNWREKNRQAVGNNAISDSLRDEVAKLRGEKDALREKLEDKAKKERDDLEKKLQLAEIESKHWSDVIEATERINLKMNKIRRGWFTWLVHFLFQWIYLFIHEAGTAAAAKYRVRYQFQRWVADDGLDHRPDTMTHTQGKHNSLHAVLKVETVIPGFFYDSIKVNYLDCSMEAVTQLCSPMYLATHSEPDVVLERLKYGARQLSTVMDNRSHYLRGALAVSNAVYPAYAIYCQEREKIGNLDFLRAPVCY